MLVHELIYQGSADNVAFWNPAPTTYKQFQQYVAQYRNYFHSCGIRRADTVGLLSRNSVEFVYSYMALASLGTVVVPLNFQLTAPEIAYIVVDAQMKRLITMESFELNGELKKHGYTQAVEQLVIPEFTKKMGREQSVSPVGGISGEDACTIIYTSGTTGKPKGAVLSHKNLVSNAQAFGEVLPVSHTDNILCVLPMYHCFAWTCAVLNSLMRGAAITILEAFSPKETVAAVKRHQVTVMYGVPPMYNILARIPSTEDMNSIRYFVSGGASLPEKVAIEFEKKYGKAIIEGYGLSEASPVVTFNLPGETKYLSIGKALLGITVTIADENDRPVPTGEIGELLVQGPNVMKGYYNLPSETEKALRDGWLHTGDLAYQDKDGYFFIVDRLKDLIIANGENIYPREVEEVLYSYPGIVETAVIGVPDELRGQAVVAYIVAGEGQTINKRALKEYLASRLAAYKIPRDFIVVDSLPKNPTGKLLKRVLRQQGI